MPSLRAAGAVALSFIHLPLLLLALPAFPGTTVLLPVSSSATATGDTIPAFPDQSDDAVGACHLKTLPSFLPAVSASCATDDGHGGGISRSRCCPVLAAWLYAAYAPTALAPLAPPAAAAAAAVDVPEPPDDTEACAAAADGALRAGGVNSLRANATCDAAFCYCGVRLRKLSCGDGAAGGGRWQPEAKAGRRLERECKIPGAGGCSRCLRALSQLKGANVTANANANANAKANQRAQSAPRNRDCMLLGLTWLLDRDGVSYLQSAAAVLRAFMAVDEAAGSGAVDASSCSVDDELPLAVDSREIQSNGGSSTVHRFSPLVLHLVSSSAMILGRALL